MSIVVINYHAQSGTVDIADDVLFRSAAFESQLAAIPGMFECTVKDVNQVYDFITGRELTLDIGGTRYWGGYLTQVEMFYATIVDTSVPADVEVRQWRLSGVDYNILFDKRVLANYAAPKSKIPQFAVGTQDGTAITALCTNYLDIGSDGISLAGVENVASLTPDDVKGAYGVPGEKWRSAMERFANTTGSTWYINASKVLVNRAREDDDVAWGFSDAPNGTTTFGCRDIRYTIDGSGVVNDALIWGGANVTGKIAFGRVRNTDSIARGLRMQYGATHFDKPGYYTDTSCTKHASIIVTGAPGSVAIVGDGVDSERGLQNPQQLLSLAWFYGQVPGPVVPGQVITTALHTFGSPGNPLLVTLPLRSVRITFAAPNLPRFEGQFGIQTSDPYSLWAYMKQQSSEAAASTYAPTIGDDETVATPGAWFTDSSPTPPTDGSTTTFTLRFPYYTASTRVYKNGVIQVRGTAYTESSPADGEITFTSAPAEGTTLYVIAQASGA